MIELSAWERDRDRVLIMGIVNATPDSFFNGGRFRRPADAIGQALRMVEEGADIIDVGGESTRPGSRAVSLQEELDRTLPVIEGIRKRSPVTVSIDTTKAQVAQEAIAHGVGIVNDISALRFDEKMAEVAASAGAFVVLMHMQGNPESMQQAPHYDEVVSEVCAFLGERIRFAVDQGIAEERIVVDPGIGFGKTLEHNVTLLQHLDRLSELERPVLVGVSRKSFLGGILDVPADERIEGTIAANAAAILRGASIIRVHDAKEGKRTAAVAERLRNHGPTCC